MGFVRNLAGGITGSTAAKASRDAARIQSESAQRAMEQQVALSRPYVDLGLSVSPQLISLAGQEVAGLPSVQPGDITQDSLFQALRDQAIAGIESSAAARGKLFSGSTPQAIAQQVQNLALSRASDIQAQNLAARQQLIGEQQQRFAQLFGVSQLGQSAAAGQAANVGNLITQQANAQAAGLIGSANARANLGQSLLAAGVGAVGGSFNPFRQQPTTMVPSNDNYGSRDWA